MHVIIQTTDNECVTSCTSVEVDGTYPSCSRGDEYVVCRNGNITIKPCNNGTIWSQNKGCCVAGTWSVGEYHCSLLCKLFKPNTFICLRIFTARKRTLRRLCFRRCLSVYRGGVSVSVQGSLCPGGPLSMGELCPRGSLSRGLCLGVSV